MAEGHSDALEKFVRIDNYEFPADKFSYDPEGVSIKLGLLDGKSVSPVGQKEVRKVRSLSMRDDDVLLCGYPKTGCHWTWEILSMIRRGKAEPTKFGKNVCWLDMVPVEVIDSLPSPRVLNSHLWYDYLPNQITEKKTKLVLTVRNPKDVAVSFYNHHVALPVMYDYNGKFHNWFELFMKGEVDYDNYFDYHADWDKAIRQHPEQPILVVYYEDLKKDMPGEIRKLCKFLGVSLEDQLIDDIARAVGFDTMKARLLQSQSLSGLLIRKGQVGDWKNWLTVAQNERIDAAVKEKLKDTQFTFQYTL